MTAANPVLGLGERGSSPWSATTEAHARLTQALRYAPSLRLVHWLTALLILRMFVLVLWIRCGDPKPDALAHRLYNLHESTGVTLWLLLLLRIVIRLIKRGPKLPPGTPRSVRVLASLNQFCRSMGSAIGVAIFGAVANGTLGSAASGGSVRPAQLPRLDDAVHHVFVAIVVVAVLMALMIVVMPQQRFDTASTAAAEPAAEPASVD